MGHVGPTLSGILNEWSHRLDTLQLQDFEGCLTTNVQQLAPILSTAVAVTEFCCVFLAPT